jgi:hypothetical protein
MADDSGTDDPGGDAATPEDWQGIADSLLGGIANHFTQDAFKDVIASAHLTGKGGELALLLQYGVQLAVKFGQLVHGADDVFLPLFAGFVAPLVTGMFGSAVNPEVFATRAASGDRGAAAAALVDAFVAAITPDTDGAQEPGDKGAKSVATAAVTATLEGWFQGASVEALLDIIPMDMAHMTVLTDLPEDVIKTLGISRLVRRAFNPLIDAVAAEPMRWAVNKKYSPKLLAESTALRQFLRGKWDWDDVAEELGRLGYTDERIDALLNELGKFFSPSETLDMVRSGLWNADEGLKHLLNAGYDQDHATDALSLEDYKLRKANNAELFAAAEEALVAGRIDQDGYDAKFAKYGPPAADLAFARAAALFKRDMAAKPLTSTEVEAAVTAGVLSLVDYRDALTREGRTSDAVDVLDLVLRLKLQKASDAVTAKQQLATEKAAAAKTKADATAAKTAEVAAARQLKAQGSEAELAHAVITGLIPMDRLVQILTPQFTPDTVQIYVADITQKKAAYDALQQKKQDAATRAANKDIPIGSLEQAVYDGIIPIDTLGTMLTQRGMSDADVSILTQVISAKKADLDAAKQKRAQADQRATAKKISLSRAEALVLLGHWTMAQYSALIQSLGFDDAAIAGMVDLLQTKVDARANGATIRAGVTSGSATKGLSLEQFRKAVIAGTKTLDDYSAYLQTAGYTADAIAVLRDELSADVDGAHAAQLRRQQGDTTGGAVAVSLSTAQKAARLGVITPAAYQARLVAGGYSTDDVALEMDLLVAEMAGTKGAQQQAATVGASPASKGLTLSQLATAVKNGDATLGEWQAAARAGNLTPDAIDTMTAALTDALAVKSDAKSAHADAIAKLAAQGVSLTALEDQVRAGTLTVAALEQQLVGYGYTDVEAQLIESLLEDELAGATGSTS